MKLKEVTVQVVEGRQEDFSEIRTAVLLYHLASLATFMKLKKVPLILSSVDRCPNMPNRRWYTPVRRISVPGKLQLFVMIMVLPCKSSLDHYVSIYALSYSETHID